jgi:pimeloyl-ACP methyl ester carboxylesterase/DNA-binding winged helix-turn-helix (wHTH) protein
VRLRFADVVVDTDRREILRAGAREPAEPQVFDLLVHLLRQRDRVVGKDELVDVVWRGRIVSDATLASRINAARRAVGDSGESQRLIRTYPRRGFRFVGEVEEESVDVPRPAPGPIHQEVRFCKARDGTRLAVAISGEGEPMVKTANWLTHVEYDWESPVWAPLYTRLSERFRLLRYDGRGNGLSERRLDETLDFGHFVDDLEDVVDACEADRFTLLGMSQGAAVAIAYAVAHPERVRRLVLIGGYAQGRERRGTPVDRVQVETILMMMKAGWGTPSSAFMQAFSTLYLPNGTAEQVRWFSDLQRRTTSPENAVALRRACDRIDVGHLLPEVRAPTLVLHARADAVVPYEQGMTIASAIPNATLVSLESENHVLLQGEPAWDRALREIEDFCSG